MSLDELIITSPTPWKIITLVTPKGVELRIFDAHGKEICALPPNEDRSGKLPDALVIENAVGLRDCLMNLIARDLIKDPDGDHMTEALDVIAKSVGLELEEAEWYDSFREDVKAYAMAQT